MRNDPKNTHSSLLGDTCDVFPKQPDINTQQQNPISFKHLFRLLQDCIKRKDIASGRKVHDIIKKNSLESNAFLGSHLIRMFASCGSLVDATEVFQMLSNPSIFSWGAIISAHSTLGHMEETISLYHSMCSSNIRPDGHVFVAVLKACSDSTSLREGRMIHVDVVRYKLDSNVFVTNILVDMYCKCGSLRDGQAVFDMSQEKTLVTWGALLSGYIQYGLPKKALYLFLKMQFKGLEVDNVVFISVLQACGSLKHAYYGKLIHVCIIETCHESDLLLMSTLIDMYAKCGQMENAQDTFDTMQSRDVIVWNALIGGYAESGDDLHTISLFLLMQEQGVEPDQVTYTILLKGRQSSTSALDRGKLVHNCIISRGLESSTVVGSSLIDMYIKCNSTEDAFRVFELLPRHDVVTWSAMIAGFIYQGKAQDAVKLSQKMRLERLELNSTTFSSILKACSSIAAFNEGKLIHADVLKSGYESDVYVASALIDMFANCGSLVDARRLFDRLSSKDVVIWNSIIAACAEHSDFASALQYYEHMRREGMKPDDVTFTSLLSACSHLGLVLEGCYHFNSLRPNHGIEPTIDHYNGVVDLLGRAGHLNEAIDMLHMMPFQENVIGWTTLLDHCKTHGDLEQGERCFHCVLSIDQNNCAAYVLMSRIYAYAGRWEDAKRLEDVRLSSTSWKKPGQAFLEIDNNVYDFVVGDKNNIEQYRDMYAKLDRLRMYMEENGYRPLMDRSSRDDSILSCG